MVGYDIYIVTDIICVIEIYTDVYTEVYIIHIWIYTNVGFQKKFKQILLMRERERE